MNKIKEILKNKNVFMGTILFICIMATTMVHAAYTTKLQLEGDAMLRARKDIRITSVELMGYSNSAYESFSPKYSSDTTSLYVSLPANSYMEYQITITNKSDVDYVVSKIDELSHNSNVTYTVSLKVNDDVIDYANSTGGTEKTFTIKISNNTSTSQTETLFLQYKFEEATYKASQLSYSNSATTCKTAQCAIDELAGIFG